MAKKRENNLIPQAHKLTKEDRQKGGKASGISKRAQKTFKEHLDSELYDDIMVNGSPMSKKQLIAIRLIRMLNDPDTSDKEFLKAFYAVRDTIGEKPVDKIQVSEITPETQNSISRMLAESEAELQEKINKDEKA